MTGTILQQRLRAKMEAEGITGPEIARQIEMRGGRPIGRGAVDDIMNGRSRNPRIDTLRGIAEILGTSVEYLYGAREKDEDEAIAGSVTTIGAVEAGAWREAVEWSIDEAYEIPQSPAIAKRFPRAPRFALEVRGPSMDRVYPPGTVVICVEPVDTAQPRAGSYVVVQRRKKDGLVEATIKQLVVDETGKPWLWPRSDHPEYQQPIRLPGGSLEDGAPRASYTPPDGGTDAIDDVVIVGWVIGSIAAAP